jgi:hypothetical protein
MLTGLDQAVDQRDQPKDGQGHPDGVKSGAFVRAGFRHQREDRDRAGQRDGHVDQEHPPPPVVGQQPASEDRAERQRHERRRRHDPARPRALLFLEQHWQGREPHHDQPRPSQREQHSRRDERAA